MKRLICEMCGSSDLVKDGGVFVCQSCGCKYSVEEAKKMMVEGTVEVQGTVKVDNSDFVEKYLANARRAYEKKDWEETEKYYNLVEQNDPSNIEAIFYSAYAKACITLISADFYKKESAFGVLSRCVGIIDDNYDPSERNIVSRMSKDILNLYSTNFVFNQSKNGYGMVVKDDRAKTINLFHSVGTEFVKSCLNIASSYPEDDKENRLYFYNIALDNAQVSCQPEFVMKVKKLAHPELVTQMKTITISNEFNGIGRMDIYLTITDICTEMKIPRGQTTTIDVPPGDYKCSLHCGLGDTIVVKRKDILLCVPKHSKIDVTYKFIENGYNLKMS